MPQAQGVNPIPEIMPLPPWVDYMNLLHAQQTPFLFILDFDLIRPLVIPLDEIQSSGIRFEVNAEVASSMPLQRVIFSKFPVPFDTYHADFEKVMSAIRAGDTYLLNLCYATRLNGLPSLEDIYEKVRAPYKLIVPNQFVVFSPEQFVSVSDGYIRTFPMKGTIDASVPDAEQKLLEDIKEQEEHATVVDLLRNDLSIVARKVKVDRYRFMTEIQAGDKTLWQCSSEISGLLEEPYKNKIGSIMQALLPAGSVTGAPKKRTVELIKAIEPTSRGYYTGVFGVYDGKNMNSAVMIRMIEQGQDGWYYRSGGGITYRSVAAREYQEMIEKVYVPM